MNKQLTKKTIGIAASAALITTMAFSGTALAERGGNGNGNGPKDGNGPQASIGVKNTCEVTVDDVNKDNVSLTLTTKIFDKTSGSAEAVITSFTAQALQKESRQYYDPVGDPKSPVLSDWAYEDIDGDGVDEKVKTAIETFDLCAEGTVQVCDDPNDPNTCYVNPALLASSKAANAQTTVMIFQGHKEEGWISRCIDDPVTEYENELETLKLERGLCPTYNAP